MKTTKQIQPASEQALKPLQSNSQSVMVRCEGFRCLAYRDRDGIWRSVFGKQPLPPILEILQ